MGIPRHDPGDCPICGAPHCSCGGGPITVEQLPATAGARRVVSVPLPPLRSTAVQETLPPGQFTSGTYRRKKPDRK
jgi:hypothetical protein